MRPANQRALQWTGTLVRVLIGVLFIYMGLNKVLDPVDFLKLTRQYNLPFDYWIVNTIAATLPWFEMFCGVLLVLGAAVRGTALVMILMLVPFTIAVALRAMQIAETANLAFCAVKFDCGCGAGEVFICNKLAENVLLTIACVILLAGQGKPLALWYAPRKPSRNKASPTVV